ncbi:MAG: lytic transglycosylase domain-containing protein [Blastocatellia bacterium]
MRLYSPAVSSIKLKALYKFVATALILGAVLTLHGRVAAPVAGATATEESPEFLALGSLTSGDPQLDRMITDAGTRYGVDPKLVYYVIRQESRFKPAARSGKDAQGLMQIIGATAERFNVKNPYDPEQNIGGGVRYLKWLLNRFNGDVRLALAGYNAGEGAVEKCGNKVPDYKETKNYVQKITTAYGKSYHPLLAPAKAHREPALTSDATD